MDKHRKLYENSLGFHEVKQREFRKIPRKNIWKKRLETAAVCSLLAISVYAGNDIYQNQHMKNNMMLETTNKMMEVGYKTVPDINGKWDQNYYLLNDFDLLSIYVSMGQDEAENVLKARGYADWQDFLEKENFSSLEEWRKQSVNEYKVEAKQR